MSYLSLNAATLDVYDNTSSYISNKKSNKNKTLKRTSFPDQIIDQEKVNQVLQSIHGCNSVGNSNLVADDDDNTELGDYTFPPPPISAGVGRATIKEWKGEITSQCSTQNQSQSQYQNQGQNTTTNTNVKEGMTNFRNLPQFQQQNTSQSQPQPYGVNEPVQVSLTGKVDNIGINNYNANYMGKDGTAEYYKKMGLNPPDKNTQKPYFSDYPENATAEELKKTNDVLLQKLNYMIHLLEEQKDERIGSVAEEVVLYSFLGIFIIFLADSFSRIGKYKR